MKRLALLAVLACLLFTFSVMVVDDQSVAREYPKGLKYSPSFTWTFKIDSTIANDSIYDTTTVIGSGLSSPPLLFSGISDFNTISGYLNIAVIRVDTNAANEYVDTTKDSVVCLFYTDWGSTASKRLVYKKVNAKLPKAGQTFYFTIPPDSILGDRLYIYFETIVSDTDKSVARSGDSCLVWYRATGEWRARP